MGVKEHQPHRIQHESDRGYTGVGPSEPILRRWLEHHMFYWKQGDVLCLEPNCGKIRERDNKGRCEICDGLVCKPDFFAKKREWKEWAACFADGSIHDTFEQQKIDAKQNQAMMNNGRIYIRFTTLQLETWEKWEVKRY